MRQSISIYLMDHKCDVIDVWYKDFRRKVYEDSIDVADSDSRAESFSGCVYLF